MGAARPKGGLVNEQPLLDAEAILSTMNRHGVRFVLIGGMAATIQGSPLRTDDIDLCPDRSHENLARLADALRDLGAKEWDPRKGEEVDRDFDAAILDGDSVWLLTTRHGPLDIVFEPAATTGFHDLDRNAREFEIGKLRVRVAALEDVIRSKQALDRERDRQQLPTLRRLLQQLDSND